MYNSIQHFQEFGVKNLEKVLENYSKDLTKVAEMVYGVTDSVVNLGLSIIAEELEFYDDWLRKSDDRKKHWHIVRRDTTSLVTSLGTVTYRKTLFIHKETGKREYLLDRYMNLGSHTRMTEDAVARVLEEAVESSYRKGGENVSIGNEVISKQTVMNKLHSLEFPPAAPAAEKKSLPYLYVDGDEDHVALQYLEKKGDIGRRVRANTFMPKIVYVYEGITNENGRNELVNVKYFGGDYSGTEGVRRLWDEVRKYIEASYDMDAVRKIYVNGDGAKWIKNGAKYLAKGRFVLDKYHMHKYIIGATAHLKDSVEDARREIYSAIHKKRKWAAEEAFERIRAVTEGEGKQKTVEAAKAYILGNWTGIMEQTAAKNTNPGCSAEGHVSHVYADRMSSRPLGWSQVGADKMARLRIYQRNGGSMLELVRYQRQEHEEEEEEIIYSADQMYAAERENRRRLGCMADMPVYTIPYPQIKKIAYFKNHIWGL